MSLEDEIDEIGRAAAGATSKTPEPVNPADDDAETAAILAGVVPGYSASRRRAQDDRREEAKEAAPLSQAVIDEARLLRDLQIRITPEEKAAIAREDEALEASKRASKDAQLEESEPAVSGALERQRAIEGAALFNEANYDAIARGELPFHEGPAPVAILADHGADR